MIHKLTLPTSFTRGCFIAVMMILFAYSSVVGQSAIKLDLREKSAKAFDIAIYVKKDSNGDFYLLTKVDLRDDAYIVSPLSTDGVYGNFALKMEETSKLQIAGDIEESPVTVGEYDTYTLALVRFVRESTIFKQKIKVMTEDDFEVNGMVFFVVEPTCVPYENTFTLTYKNGEMKVSKVEKVVSAEYAR